ncbi:MAG: hypothetical protein ABIQ81_01180 [Novosphingobium sp.]
MRIVAGVVLILGLATTAAAQPRGEGRAGRPHNDYADPSAVIAADLALSRIAREKGEREALRKLAATNAVLFAPRAVAADAWLKRQAPPAAPTRWQARSVWLSCDGGYAVSRGAWTRGDASGDYLAVWQRQKKGDWKWLVRDEAPASDLGAPPEMISGRVAECAGLARRRSEPESDPLPLAAANADSRDHSLKWSFQVDPQCGRSIAVEVWNGTAYDAVVTLRRDPPAGACG